MDWQEEITLEEINQDDSGAEMILKLLRGFSDMRDYFNENISDIKSIGVRESLLASDDTYYDIERRLLDARPSVFSHNVARRYHEIIVGALDNFDFVWKHDKWIVEFYQRHNVPLDPKRFYVDR